MKSIRLLPEQPATTPDGFTLQGYIDSGEFGYPLGGKIPLKVLFEKDAAPYLYETKIVPNQKLTEQTNGKLLLAATVRDDVQLRWWLKGFAEKVDILEPADLRNEFATMASKMAEKYHQVK
jgi:predicted DNA-binding transcriptional regulator YafY